MMIIKYLKVLVSMLVFCEASALDTTEVAVSLGSGPYFYADFGNCATRDVPRAAYVTINVENLSSTDTLYNIDVKLDSMSNTSNGFKLLSYRDDSTYRIPRILPNSTVGAFFYIQFPCSNTFTTELDFSLTDTSATSVSFEATISTTDVGRASAGGDVTYQSIAGIDAQGIIVVDTVTYSFGNYNGDELYFQPAGDTLFPVNSLILYGSKVISSSLSACGPAPGDLNTYYYFDTGNGCGGGSSNEVVVAFYYLSTVFNDSAFFKPYAGMKSGGPIKYTSNYGDIAGAGVDTFGTTTASNKFSISKTSSCGVCNPGDTITYTITITNAASEALMFDEIRDSLPVGLTFVEIDTTSEITRVNSSVYPISGDSGVIYFTGLIPQNFPYRSYVIQAGDSISLVYKAQLPSDSSNDLLRNTAIGSVGGVNFDTATSLSCAGCTALPVTMIYYRGKQVGSTIELDWETAQEINNDGFEIYRTSATEDMVWKHFELGMGTTAERTHYEWIDQNPPASGNVLYTLVQRDFDGKSTSYTTSLILHPSVTTKFWPNPVHDVLRISTNAYSEISMVRILNTRGQEVYSSNAGWDESISVEVERLPSGVYIVEVYSGLNQLSTVRIVKH